MASPEVVAALRGLVDTLKLMRPIVPPRNQAKFEDRLVEMEEQLVKMEAEQCPTPHP